MWTQIEGSMISDLTSIFLENGLCPGRQTLEKIAEELKRAFYESNKDYFAVMAELDRQIELYRQTKKLKTPRNNNNIYHLMLDGQIIMTADKMDPIISFLQEESGNSYQSCKAAIFNYGYNNNRKILKKYDFIKEKKEKK